AFQLLDRRGGEAVIAWLSLAGPGLLELDRQAHRGALRPRADPPERRDALPGELRREGGPGVDRADLRPGPLAQKTAPARGPIEGFVMHQNRHAVAGSLDVQLDLVRSVARATFQTRRRVLRPQRGRPAMSDHPAPTVAHPSRRVRP